MTKFWNAVKIPLLAILCSLVVGGVIIAVTGSNPFKAYYALLQGSGLSPKSSYASYKSICPETPILNKPARRATATANAAKIIGVK